MESDTIKRALGDISAEQDPTLKHLKLAGLVSAIFREAGIDIVVVGGSAIEFYTEGAYVSGDLDLCFSNVPVLALRKRQELMGKLAAEGGPRSWKVAGEFVDVLGALETVARTHGAQLATPFGRVQLTNPEELLAERVLVSVYPGRNHAAAQCAAKLAAVALARQIDFDWSEARRLAGLAEYGIVGELESLVARVAYELGRQNPYHPSGPAH